MTHFATAPSFFRKQTIIIPFLLMSAVLLAGITSCDRNDSRQETASDYSAMVATADSLIDISPDSTLVICRQFFQEYTDETDSLYPRMKVIEGNAYFSIGDLDEAISSMSLARELSRNSNDLYTLVNATTDLGIFMRIAQQPDSALTLYNEALSLIQDGDFPDEKAHLLTSIAILYANTGHLDEAADYASLAVDAAKTCGDADMIMYATSQAGAIYNLLGRKEIAYQLTREAIADARSHQLPRYELKALGHMIDLHLKDGRMDSVTYYLRRGDTISRQFPTASVEGIGFLEEKYVALAAMGRYRESLAVQKEIQRLQAAAPVFPPSEKLWLRMARNYQRLHLSDSAAICFERAVELSDSLRGAESERSLNEFYARFKTAEKELALTEMERRKARSDMWMAIWLGIAAVLAGLVALSFLYLRTRRRKEQMRLLQSHIDGIESERGRLAKDLHDGICNDLYAVGMLLQTDISRDELLTDIEKIRTDVRRISHELMPPSLQDVGLAEAIDAMVGKTQLSFPAVDMNFAASPKSGWDNIPPDISYGVYRICQEILGNILRHNRPKRLDITLQLTGEYLSIEFRHDGKQIVDSDKPAESNEGIGLKSIRQRLTAIGATAQGLPDSSCIQIRCPLDR